MSVRPLARDERAATIVEFALVVPVMLMLCLGLSELAFQSYAQSVLTGAVEKAGRDSTIEDNVSATNKLDTVVQNQMKVLVPSATFTFTRKNYDNYAAMAGEPFVDEGFPDKNDKTTRDGKCDHGEAFTDLNGNGRYDKTLDEDGQGAANDVTLYTAEVTYNRLFPIESMMGWDSQVKLAASTILKTQPYANQNKLTGVKSGNCT